MRRKHQNCSVTCKEPQWKTCLQHQHMYQISQESKCLHQVDQAEVRQVAQVVEVSREEVEVVEEDPLLVVQAAEAQAVVVHLEDQEVQAQEDQVDHQEDRVDRCLKTLMQLLLEFTLQVLGYSMHLMVITWMLSNKKPDLLIYASPMLHLSDNSIITLGHHV